MTLVIDTNVMNGMFVTNHAHAPIRHAWHAGRFKWAVSTDILQEYEEVLARLRGAAKAEEILSIVMELGARFDTRLEGVSVLLLQDDLRRSRRRQIR